MISIRVPAVELLTAAEEVDLARRMEARVFAEEVLRGVRRFAGATVAELRQIVAEGLLARERYIMANLRLVTMVAGRAARQSGLSEHDLFQEGVGGLIHAVDRFDHRHGVRFATYALPWIRARVGRAVANRCGALAVSDKRAARRGSVRLMWQRLSQEQGCEASCDDVAEALGLSTTLVGELLTLEPPCALIDEDGLLVDPPDPGALGALDEVTRAESPVRSWVRQLPSLQRRVIELRFGFDAEVHSYADAAEALSLSKSTVRRIEQRALDTLRGTCPSGALAKAS